VKKSTGFTLIEIAVCVGVMVLLAGIGFYSFRNQGEMQDAALANSIQGALQTALGQICLRTERTPADVFTNFRPNIIGFAASSLQQDIVNLTPQGNNIQLRFVRSGRTVDFGLNAIGDVMVVNETFNGYRTALGGQLEEGP
jgi:Tfp pilus assembly protein FimT